MRDYVEETRELLRGRRRPFRRRVRKVGDCLVWLGYRNHGGYGFVHWVGGNKARNIEGVHRVVYRHFNGNTIPEGWEVDHLCNRRACVNPAHLQTLPPHMNSGRGHVQSGHRMCPHPNPDRNSNNACRDCRREYYRQYRKRNNSARAWQREYDRRRYRLRKVQSAAGP